MRICRIWLHNSLRGACFVVKAARAVAPPCVSDASPRPDGSPSMTSTTEPQAKMGEGDEFKDWYLGYEVVLTTTRGEVRVR